jgi:uncharacterized protein YndB with AHSA1/START domain
MTDRVEREIEIAASPEDVWDAVTGDGWLAEEVDLDLHPGGGARFRSDGEAREGWVEEALAPSRLAFWWAPGDEPATRVELTIEPREDGCALRVVETRPLDVLDLVGLPLPGLGRQGRSFGPALVAA